jgi:hypothetical protein
MLGLFLGCAKQEERTSANAPLFDSEPTSSQVLAMIWEIGFAVPLPTDDPRQERNLCRTFASTLPYMISPALTAKS